MPYAPTIREEELKNKVAADVFGAFDCTRILGAVDFCVTPKVESQKSKVRQPTTDSRQPRAFQLFNLSTCAQRVLDAGRTLWRHYHAQPGALPDASFYDIRAHFQGFNAKGHMNPDSADSTYSSLIADLRTALKALAAQITPKVYEHGFLK